MALVSVVIPTFCGGDYLGEAVKSVFAQTRTPAEIIVVDDCSPDDTVEIAEAMADDSPLPMRVISLPTNSGGPAHPINVGIEAADGDLIAVLEQDDVFAPTKIESQARLLETDPDIACVFSLFGRMGGKSARSVQSPSTLRALHRKMSVCGDCLYAESERAQSLLFQRGMIAGGFPGYMFRRTDWSNLGGVNESIRVSADFDFILRLARCGKLAFLPKIAYLRRLHGGNLSSRNIQGHLDSLRTLARQREFVSNRLRPILSHAIARKISQIAMCLASANQWRAASHFLKASSRYESSAMLAYRAAKLPLYWAYCRLARNPWSLDSWDVENAIQVLADVICPP